MISNELELMQAWADAQAEVDAALLKFGTEWLGKRQQGQRPTNPIGNQGPATAPTMPQLPTTAEPGMTTPNMPPTSTVPTGY